MPEGVSLILETLDSNKALNVVVFERPGGTMGDHIILASGTSSRHVSALAGYVEKALKGVGVKGLSIEGLEYSNWVVLDAMSVCVHIFRPEVREHYKLESLYKAEIPQPAL